MHRKLREAMLRLVIKTDVKDISSVGQSPTRVTLHKTQNLNVWVMDETGMDTVRNSKKLNSLYTVWTSLVVPYG